MPRFYFDLMSDGRASPDLDGTDLPGAEAARSEAARCFGEMIRCAAVAAPPQCWSMEVHDGRGGAVATISYRMTGGPD